MTEGVDSRRVGVGVERGDVCVVVSVVECTARTGLSSAEVEGEREDVTGAVRRSD